MAAEKRLEVLSQKLGKEIPISEIGYETVWFMKDKVDDQLVPANLMIV